MRKFPGWSLPEPQPMPLPHPAAPQRVQPRSLREYPRPLAQWTGVVGSLVKPHPRPGHAGTQVKPHPRGPRGSPVALPAG